MNDEMNKETAPQAEPSQPSSTAKPDGEYKAPIFLDLVISVGAGALQVLVFEAADKDGPNLDLARYSIDMLELLKAKAKGNLEKDEEKFLDETIHQLRMKYVEAAKKAGEEAK
jgi:hypothetical protein